MIQTDPSHVNNLFLISRKQLQNLNLFWFGFITYILSATFSEISLINPKIFQLIQLIGLVFLIIGSIKLIRFKIEGYYIKTIYIFYCFWLFILIITGASYFSNKEFLFYFLLNPNYGGMFYFIPLILLFPKKLFLYNKLMDAIFLVGIFYIFFDIIFIRDLLSSDQSSLRSQGIVEKSFDLGISCGFLLLTYPYQFNKKKLLGVAVILLTLAFAIIRARRGLILMISGVIFFSLILYLINSKKKMIIIYLSTLIFSLCIIYASHIYKPKENRFFGFIMERGQEDTRTGVEDFFYADMKTKDWIIGKGINGQYFCPAIEQDQETNYRSVIETGYLQLILKGGILSLGLLLLISIPAIILGLFYSQNTLSKASAIWILLALISLYPATVVTFSLRYLIVWLAIGICYSKKIRNFSDAYLKEYFLNN
jgi:hypothetical protein